MSNDHPSTLINAVVTSHRKNIQRFNQFEVEIALNDYIWYFFTDIPNGGGVIIGVSGKNPVVVGRGFPLSKRGIRNDPELAFLIPLLDSRTLGTSSESSNTKYYFRIYL